MTARKSIFRRIACALGRCPCRTADNDTHIWGECTICGEKFGVVSREFVRRHSFVLECDAAFAARMKSEASKRLSDSTKGEAAA